MMSLCYHRLPASLRVLSLMDKLSLLHLLLIFTAIACMALLASLIR
ncbi:hypothetical protein [Pseudomonas oryzihabitans]|nr:hypothetical protein [Pseudomonas oryzihabitans]